MALTEDEVIRVAEEMISALVTSNQDDRHHGLVRRYLAGRHNMPYAPPGATAEYKSIAAKSITNWLPLLSDTFVKSLFVDGVRIGTAKTNAPVWAAWNANGLNARQSVVYRGAVEYGCAYVLVLPGDPTAVIRPLAATRAMAWYEDDDDEWPVRGIVHTGTRIDGSPLYSAIDDTYVWPLVMESQTGQPASLKPAGPPQAHGLGVCPMVRFRDRLDAAPLGIIAPLIPIQDRINEIVFNWSMALHYAAFRQRWATGLAIPVDTQATIEIPNEDYDPDGPDDPETNPKTLIEPNPNFGQPIESFDAATDHLWTAPNEGAKFGDFGQTDTSDHRETYKATVQTLAGIAQVPPNVLFGDINNVSADALASIYDSTTRKLDELRTIFSEAWRQVFRLAARAAGGGVRAIKADYVVRWRDTEARSLSATVDALGKMVQMLGVPNEGAWEMIPGVTDDTIDRWRAMEPPAPDGLTQLANELRRQNTPNPATDTPPPES